ncbi:MAG: hypothetical protein ACI94Y_002497 [Maribacter sp.]
MLYLAVFALQTNVSSNCLIFRSYEFLTIRKPINSQYISGGLLRAKINYQSLEIPLGIRYYIPLNDKSKLFVNASYVIDAVFGSSVYVERVIDDTVLSDFKIYTKNNFAFGLGYKYNEEV